MPRSLQLILALMLVSVVALGGDRKDTGRIKKGDPLTLLQEKPLTATEKAVKITPRKSTSSGATLSVGVYTTLEGYYDYQSNGGGNQYIRVDPANSNNIHVVYMVSDDAFAVNAARGTAYAVSTDGGVTWNNFTNVRIPTGLRSGFPSMDLLSPASPAAGQPIIMNHYQPGDDLASFANFVDDAGNVTSFNDLPALNPPVTGGQAIWPFVAGTANGSVVFQASVSNTTTAPGEQENFINRTTDGITWLDPWITTIGFERAGGRYPTFANTNGRVATIVPINLTGGDSIWLMESTDNGATWLTPTVLYDGFRVTPAGLSSPYLCSDGVYDGDNAYVVQQSLIWDPVDTSATNSDAKIEFWSQATGWVDVVADPLQFSGGSGGTNHFGSVGYPGIGMSGSTVVVVFQGFLGGTGTLDPNGFRHSEIFLTRSNDAGATWSLPVNVTNTPLVDERYPSISKFNDAGFAHLTWQEDITAGSSSFTDLTDTTLARQVYYKANLSTIFPDNDLTALSIDEVSNGFGILSGSSYSPKATFRNIGLLNQTNVDVKFEIYDPSDALVYTNTKQISSINSGQTQQVTFDAVPGSATTAIGLYTTRAVCLLTGDLLASNDTTENNFNVTTVVVVPGGGYSTDFESPVPEGGSSGWYAALASGSGSWDWVLGTPAKAHIGGAHSGVNAWVTKLTGTYSNNEESYVASPSFDLTALPANVLVEFWHNFQIEGNWDGGLFEYSTNGGTVWVTVDTTLGVGSNFNTGSSIAWYNENIDSGATAGFNGPPMWSDSSSAYASHSSGWIQSRTVIPVGGLSDVRLRWRWSADASAVFEGWALDDVSITSAAAAVNVGIDPGWNMVSSPVMRAAGTDSVRNIYPNSQFPYAFSFAGASGYQQQTIMQNGKGYWAKFPGAEVNNIAGSALIAGALAVTTGWNMVGSISSSVDTATIVSSPPGLKASHWFGFSGAYAESPTIEPGKAYWVKASGTGTFYLADAPGPAPAKAPGVNLADLFNSITITDANGSARTLYFGADENNVVSASFYEMPPVPPAGAFDARFENENTGTMLVKHLGRQEGVQMPIAIQSPAYPLEVSWNVTSTDRQYVLSDGLGAVRTMAGEGTMKVEASGVNRLYIGVTGGDALPVSYALLQNYPNPFNPSTKINFALPAPSKVSVEIFNLIGQKVRTLVNDAMPAGYHSVEWNGTGATGQLMGSGVYFVRFSANGGDGNTFNDVRKLMLMK